MLDFCSFGSEIYLKFTWNLTEIYLKFTWKSTLIYMKSKLNRKKSGLFKALGYLHYSLIICVRINILLPLS
jgi:hypothetical protein